MAQPVLENIDPNKKEKFKSKLERLEEDSWNRENFESNFKEALNAIENIDDFVTGLVDDFNRIEGNQGYDSDYTEIKQKIGKEFYKNKVTQKNLPYGKADSQKLKEKHRDAKELQVKINEWRTLQLRLAMLAMQKLNNVAEGYKEEYVSAEVAGRFEDYAEKMIEEKMDRKAQELKYEFSQEIAQLEQTLQAVRKESKFYRNWFEDYGEIILSEISSEPDTKELGSESDSELDEFSTDSGNIDLSGESQEREEEEKEEEGLMDELSPQNSGEDEESLPTTSTGEAGGQPKPGQFKLKGKDIQERGEVFEEMRSREDIDLENMSAKKVAKLTDMSDQYFYKDGGILDQLEEEFGHTFGIRD